MTRSPRLEIPAPPTKVLDAVVVVVIVSCVIGTVAAIMFCLGYIFHYVV